MISLFSDPESQIFYSVILVNTKGNTHTRDKRRSRRWSWGREKGKAERGIKRKEALLVIDVLLVVDYSQLERDQSTNV